MGLCWEHQSSVHILVKTSKLHLNSVAGLKDICIAFLFWYHEVHMAEWKVCYIEGNYDKGTLNLVHKNESLLYWENF